MQAFEESRSLNELFPIVLDLAIQAVNAQRGVLLILEGDTLVARAHKGEGFRISSAVRDRVLQEKSSILVRDAQLDDAFKGRMSIVEQKVHTMMAVPLQTKDRIIGLIYLDSPFVLREFTKDDLSLLTIMANLAAFRIVSGAAGGSGGGRAPHAPRPQPGRRDSKRHAAGPGAAGRPAPTWPASTPRAAPSAAITTISSLTPTAASRWRSATSRARACPRR